MHLYVTLKSEHDKAPYRVFLDNEMLTERMYSTYGTNILMCNVSDTTKKDLVIQSVTDKTVHIDKYEFRDEPYED